MGRYNKIKGDCRERCIIIYSCPICASKEKIEIFREDNVPIFQNKIYSSEREARLVELGSICLSSCRKCGFVWNSNFDYEMLHYDSKYQNEQSYSREFKKHLYKVKQIIEERNPLKSHIVEIGCGKGTFLNILHDSGYFNIMGFDPAYEGESPFIQKSYYPPEGNYSHADLFIMRHVLEHVPEPLNFLKKINRTNKNKSKIYIEVPAFEWIVRKGAFWDISYEHCNYFTRSLLGSILPDCETGYLFGDQYIYATGDFVINPSENTKYLDEKRSAVLKKFKEKLDFCRRFVGEHPNLALWGAGAKGANFARMIDPDCEKIQCIVDINPKKQGHYIAGSAHPIISPEELMKNNVEDIIIMNENYSQEIKSTMILGKGDYFVLDKCLMKV